MRINYLGLCAAIGLLALRLAPDASGFDLRRINGQTVTWDPPAISMQVKLGSSPLLFDGTNYNSSVQAAMDTWNANLGTVQLVGSVAAVGLAVDNNSVNEIAFGSQVYPGEDFDANVLAVTISYYSGTPRSDGTYRRTQADIVFNTKYTWNSYRGVLQQPEDIRRVVLHELGHVLGLGHPDEATPPQSVTALMNSRESNLDTLANDDITGAQVLYGTASASAPPVIVAQPGSQTVYSGSAINFSVGVIGTQPLSFQWRKNGTAISGATQATLIFGSVQTADAGSYSVIVTNPFGTATSSSATLVVNQTVAPSISPLPATINLSYGAYLQIYPSVTGTPFPTLQWKKDGVAITNATGTTYTKGSVTTADNGSYTLTATNPLGTVVSSAAVLTVAPVVPVTITTQPVSVAVALGLPAYLSVSVKGSDPISIQWYRNGQPIVNAYGTTFSISAVTLASGGTYTVRATNDAGTVESNPATLTVLPAALPTFQIGSSPTTISATTMYWSLFSPSFYDGSPPYTYQWFKDGVAIVGATGVTYSKSNLTEADAGNYSFRVTNAAGVVMSPDMVVRWLDDPSAATWIDSFRLGNIVYFLATSPGRIMRYDLVQETWLSTVLLSGTQAPTAFLPTPDAVFIAYGTTLVRRSPDLQVETPVATSPAAIKCLFSYGNLVYYYDGTNVASVNRSTFVAGPTFAPPFPWAGYGAFSRNVRPIFSNTLQRGYSTRPQVSPDDVIQFTVASDGTFTNSADTPYHGDLPVGTRQYLTPDEQRLVDNSGTVYNLSNLTYAGSFGFGFQDLTYLDDGSPVILRGKTVSLRASASLVELGRVTLPASAYALFSQAGATFAFGAATSNLTTPVVTKLARASFAPTSSPAAGTSASTRFSVDDMFIDNSGVINLVSRTVHGVVRWSTQTQSFLPTIALRGNPSVSNYSSVANRLVVAYSDSAITEFKFALDTVERPVMNLANVAMSVVAMDDLTMMNIHAYGNTGDMRLTFDSQGAVHYLSSSVYYGRANLWTSPTRRLYSTLPFTTGSMAFETVPTSGVLPGQGNGVSNILTPLRANAAGTVLLSPNGRVLSSDLAELGSLGTNVIDGAWMANGLYTIRGHPGGTEVQQWARLTYALSGNLILPGLPLRVFPVSDTRVAIVTLLDGYVAFYLVDSDRVLVGSWANIVAMPAIITQPASTTFSAGGSVTLSVYASGGILNYQWRRNGVALAGQTASSLVLSNLSAADSGASFDVLISNSVGSLTSAAATVSLAAAKLSQTITFAPLAGKSMGTAPFAVGATASSGLVTTFSIVSGPATISGNTLTLTGVGTVVVRASQAGNFSYEAAPSVDQSFTVAKGFATVLITNLSQAADGSPKSATVTTVPAGLPVVVTYNGSTTLPIAAGTYVLVATINSPNYDGSASVTMLLTGAGNGVPVISVAPAGQVVTVGGTAFFSVVAGGTPPPTYQWRRNGVNLAGQTGSTLTLAGLTLADSGAVIDVVVSNSVGSITSAPASLVVSPRSTTRGEIYFGTIAGGGQFAIYVNATGEGILIGMLPNSRGSFVIRFAVASDGSFSVVLPSGPSFGASMKGAEAPIRSEGTVVLNARISGGSVTGSIPSTGETLAGTIQPSSGSTAGVAGFYEAPVINSNGGVTYFIVGTGGSVLGSSVMDNATQAVTGTVLASGQFTLALGAGATWQGTFDSGTGAVSGQMMTNGSSTGAFGGVAATVAHTDRLVNISTRGLVGDGEKAMFAGFVISGSQPKRVLIRASGPTLTSYGVGGAMDNPVLKIFSGTQQVLSNDDWNTSTDATLMADTAARVGGFALTAGSKDAALITTLSPGIYSAQVTRAPGSTTGLALVEVYDSSNVPGVEEQKVVNISTRGEVGTGESIMIAGFVITGNVPKKVLIRGVGPTLGSYGVGAVLANPLLKLYLGSTLIATNDDWGTGPGALLVGPAALQVGGFPLLADSKDSALLVTLAPGIYSAQISGVGGTTGVVLLEVYEVP